MWSTVENNLGIIVVSIPTLAPLFKYYAEKTHRSSTANSTSHPRSLYALKPRCGTREGSYPFRSGAHQATHVRGPSEGAGSKKFILCDIATITKRTEVTVSTRVKGEPHPVLG
jgi:hypothetical protein